MKKNIICLVLLVLTICTAVFYRQYKNNIEDPYPPVFSCDEPTITASVSVTEEDLLRGVTAYDKVSGDVSDTIVIEEISNFIAENQRIVTYAAIDDRLNVARFERTLIYTDYESPTFSLSAPLCYPEGSRINVLNGVRANSTLDGDLTARVRYGLDNLIDNMTPGTYPVEYRVTDSCGKTSYLNTEIMIYDSKYTGIDVKLTKYLTYLSQGQTFVEDAYFKSSSEEGTLTIDADNVDTSVPGTYYADYIVTTDTAAGRTRMIVVVE